MMLRHSRAIGVLRYHLYRDILLAFPRFHLCNICGWRGRRFLKFVQRGVLCPRCGSMVRHRLLAAALTDHPIGARVRVGRTLHISPEYCLGLVFRPRATHYVRADYVTASCDVRQDITRMPFRDGVFDTLVACDTLEHIVADRAAFREMHRVLRPGGVAILTVPQSENDTTDEDASVDSPETRLMRFGQDDHVRNYGTDFGDRVAEAGFKVSAIDRSAFPPAFVTKHVLAPPFPVPSPFGWNNRTIYLAERR
jgi:SAM-dependent methyltransferase